MPAKKVVTKERVLYAAIDIIREGGSEMLNVREIAKRCGCSTQPVYSLFGGMAGLKSELSGLVAKIYSDYIDGVIQSGKYPEYKAIGMGYIGFAKEHKQLFKYLMMTPHEEKHDWEKLSYDVSTGIITDQYGLERGEAELLHTELWIFVHGVATMFATDYLDWDWELVSKMVTDAFKGFSANLNGDKK